MENNDSRLCSKEAEAALLGSLIRDPNQAVTWLPKIHDSLFSVPEHQNILRAIKSCIQQYSNVDLVLLRSELAKEKRLQATGGVHYLIEVAESTPVSANTEYYLRICKERFISRMANKIGTDIHSRLIDGVAGTQVMAMAEQDILKAMKDSGDTNVVSAGEAIDEISFSLGSYIQTGFVGIDNAIYGAGAGDMIVVAGRPQAGKSCLLLNIASNMASKNIPVALFSLEMTATQYLQRLLCAKAKINFQDAIKGSLSPSHQKSLSLARQWIRETKLYIDDNAFLTPQHLRLKLMQMKTRYGIQACFIDYLQLMRTGDFSSLYEKTTEISKQIKSVAVELQIPIITAAQLNREMDKREDGRPRISDLRDSGSVEQDADIILLIHRPGLSTNSDNTDCEVIVGKNRRGERPSIKMHFVPQYTTFIETDALGG